MVVKKKLEETRKLIDEAKELAKKLGLKEIEEYLDWTSRTCRSALDGEVPEEVFLIASIRENNVNVRLQTPYSISGVLLFTINGNEKVEELVTRIVEKVAEMCVEEYLPAALKRISDMVGEVADILHRIERAEKNIDEIWRTIQSDPC